MYTVVGMCRAENNGMYIYLSGPGISVGIATDYVLDGPG